MQKIVLKQGREKALGNKHPWLFSGAIAQGISTATPGDMVQVATANGKIVGTAFYHPKNSLALRMINYGDQVIDTAFWREKLLKAWNYRCAMFDSEKTNAFRVIHGESDGFSGLTLDYYAGYCVLQISAAGLDRMRDTLLTLITDIIKPRAIYERSDIPSRKVEGLPTRRGLVSGSLPEGLVQIMENGLLFYVDIPQGQKTGFFLDQRDNRARVERLVKGRNVLNCFCYTGGFSVYAARGGARRVTSVDIDAEALALVERHVQANRVDPTICESVAADGIDFLRGLPVGAYDAIILDPPAFAKNREAITQAARGYKEINRQALRVLPSGGVLITCSCSQHMERGLFQKIVHDAAVDAGKEVQIIEYCGQAPDHPVNLNHPEGEYLKVLFAHVV